MASPPKAVPVSSNSTDTEEEQQEDTQGEQSSPSPPPPSSSPPPPSPSRSPPAVPPPQDDPPPSPPPPSPSPPTPSPPPPTPSSPSPPLPAIPPPSPPPPEGGETPPEGETPTQNDKPPSQDDKAAPEGKTPPQSSQTPSNKHTPPNKPDTNLSIPPPTPKSNWNTPELPPAAKPDAKSSPEGISGGFHKSAAKEDDPTYGNDEIILGAAIAVAMFFILIVVTAVVCYLHEKKKKKFRHNMRLGIYPDGGAANGFFNGGGPAPPKWHAQGGDHNIKVPPPPGSAAPAGGGWNGAPSPLSGEMNSASYSGPHGSVLPPPSPNIALGFNKSTFTYEELAAATGGFSQSNMIGQGGFGYVFKGTLPNGKDVAVKQLKAGSGQGEREFQAEVEIISRVHHRHLVSLVGYCIAGAHRLLIYEFVPNKTLEYHLHGKGVPVMDWPTRLKIALGSAKGLAYLHEDCHPRIIHRDIKTANILIDYKFEAMVADFGLAKLSSDTNTHVSTRVMGTFGYLAPEYASTGKLTDRSDVFSFGVMVLELITGRRPVDHTNRMEDSLVDWARPMVGQILADENYGEIVDPRLEGNYNPVEMASMIACGAACVRHSAKRRPRMSQIVRALEGDMISFDDMNEGAKPGQSSQVSSGTGELESGTYSSKMRQFQRVAMASGEYTGEYSGVTSEYGLNPSDSSASSSGEMRFGAGRKTHAQV